MKKLVIGILAHVDAGKTTLSEGLLYLSGSIRKLGRVDDKNAFLDTYELERARGITIFSKQAVFTLGDTEVTLLDTPGHIDFSAEMERTLRILDYAILVINGADGVQGHTQTLWRLLEQYKIPTLLFVNKMDQNGTDHDALLEELKIRLDASCLDFGAEQDHKAYLENLAMCDEKVLDQYLETGVIEREDIIKLISLRKVFPCYFGSALKLTGVKEFLQGLEQYTRYPIYPEEFGARVYKIGRDDQGNRLTYMKITGGSLKVKALLTSKSNENSKAWEEKADQIRIYSGAKYETVNEAKAGTVCAVTGLTKTYSGEGLGIEESNTSVLEPVLMYQILMPQECDVHRFLLKLRQLEEEEPQLRIVWNEQLSEIHAQLMGEVQTEVLKSLILERFAVEVEFGLGNIVYKETILEPVEGVGHFEPLRHYAEVHLLLEPGEPGSGMQFTSVCSEDLLDRNWQRLILTHLEEKEHRGVLTGSVITDIKITLMVGRAHLKHTEGGDFRQATYRAVRQGLKKARCILLEPYYDYRLEIPSEMVGRALSDIQKMHGVFTPPQLEGGMSILSGSAPVAAMRDYQTEVIAYTSGQGRLSHTLKGYKPCHNAEEVITAMGYDSERDLDNPTGSVFCSHGAGFVVKWDQVKDYMHLESGLSQKKLKKELPEKTVLLSRADTKRSLQGEKELEEIFARTYGSPKPERVHTVRYQSDRIQERTELNWKKSELLNEYLLVDGYNIIFSWAELKDLAEVNIDAARTKLMDILCNYQGFKQCILILVFDAYLVEGNIGEVLEYNNIRVVYTKEAQTADLYIEKVVHELGKTYQVTVATSDKLEQMIILGQGGNLLSAQGLKEEIERIGAQIRSVCLDKQNNNRNLLFHYLTDEMADYMEDVRLGKKDIE